MRQKFQICPVCKLPGFRLYRLCRYCAQALRRGRRAVERRNLPLVVRSVFAWDDKSPQAVADLVYSLKGVQDPDAWWELALWMVEELSPQPEGAVIVPVPGSRPNHAYGLSLALGRILGCPVEDALITVRRRRQKALSRGERRGVSLRLRGLNPCRDYKRVLIVDDVVTTGATLRSAHAALGSPREAQAWCLLDRRPCDDSSPLL